MENTSRRKLFSVDDSLSVWNEKEMQLVRLHEELVTQRECLLNCSTAYSHSQDLRARREITTSREAVTRNQKLLQDIESSYQVAFDALNSSPTPRFMTLQKNYWAMVKSQVPMWQEELGIRSPKGKTGTGHTVKGQGHSQRSRSHETQKQRRQQRRASKSPRAA